MNFGFPMSANFSGELVILQKVAEISGPLALYLCATLFFTTAYLLWLLYKIFKGYNTNKTLIVKNLVLRYNNNMMLNGLLTVLFLVSILLFFFSEKIIVPILQ